MSLLFAYTTMFCLDEEERAGCFALIVFLSDMWLYLTVQWVGLQWVIVVFLDHTILLSNAVTCVVVFQIQLLESN